MMMNETLARPAHVPPELVVDFDFTAIPGEHEDIHLAWKKIQDSSPDIFWTPRNGGHWVAMRAEDIGIMQADHERFSYRHVSIPSEVSPFRLIPLELDPPEHTPFRALLAPVFSPRSIAELEIDARKLCTELIDGFIDRGECEFISEFARHLPIVMFLKIVSLPVSDRLHLLHIAELVHHPKTNQDRLDGSAGLQDYVQKWIVERRKNPGPDLFSKIVNAKINGKDCTPEETFGFLANVMFGGLDTVASSMGFFARCLAERPELCRQLIEEPSLIPGAIEEMLRRFSIPHTARVITHDLGYKGLHFKKNDQILLSKAMFNLDERKYDDPLKVDIRRKEKFHAGFGDGVHRCPGSGLARMELRVFLEEWLKRIPDFSIKAGEKAVTVGGLTNGIVRLPLSWK